MFKRRTLFIVGAGASAEARMPVGRDLADQIIQSGYFRFDFYRLVGGDAQLLSILKHKFRDEGELDIRLKAARKISDGIFMASSIDNYIDMHADDLDVAEVGKLHIAYSLLNAERNSRLFFEIEKSDQKLDLRSLSDTWYHSFARILFEKQKRSAIEEIGTNVSIISFNYDRCIEFYLIEAVRQAFGIGYGEAHAVVSKIEIIHPYGCLGKLPSLLGGRGGDLVPFGMETDNFDAVWATSEKLKTYSEQISDETVLGRIRDAVGVANQIVFLGFAFHPQNMEILKLPSSSERKTIYSTGYGISRYEIEEVTTRIIRLYSSESYAPALRKRVSIVDGATCAALFNEQWRNLSAA